MAGEDKSAYRIEKFDGKKFGFWWMQIEDYLYGKKLHQQLLDSKPKGMSDAEWKLLYRHVLKVIALTLSRGITHNVAKEETKRIDDGVFRRQKKQFGKNPRERRIGKELKAKTIGNSPMKKMMWVPRVEKKIGMKPSLIDNFGWISTMIV